MTNHQPPSKQAKQRRQPFGIGNWSFLSHSSLVIRHSRRSGITLTEVLVAIFVTGMGLMALMTLFPLGAVNMSLAIKDDRAAHCAANAAAYLRTVWRQGLESRNPDPAFDALASGLPVYLDPIGFNTYTAGNTSVGGAGVIPRVPLQTLPPLTFSLMDDIEFDFNGAAITAYGQLPREYLYTWAYMLRPPPLQETVPLVPGGPPLPPRAVDYSVVVYNRRGTVPGINRVPEDVYTGTTFNYGSNNYSIYVPVPTNKLKVHKGSWVLDMTVLPSPYRHHAFFYRVDSVTAGANGTALKVDQPLRGFEGISNRPWPAGTIVFMDNVVEVFEKSTLE